MKIIIQLLLSACLLFVGYEGMVKAFHLLNEPSDRAVYTGLAILALLCILLPLALWYLWRRKHVSFR